MTEKLIGSIGNAVEECFCAQRNHRQRPGLAERRNRRFWPVAALMLIGVSSFYPAKSQELYFYVANTTSPRASVALRTQPSLNSDHQVSELPKGTKLRVLELRPGGWWKVEVSPSGPQGWVLGDEGNQLRVQCCILQSQDPAPSPHVTAPARSTAQLSREDIERQRQERSRIDQMRAKERYEERQREQTLKDEQEAQKNAALKAFHSQLDALPAEPESEERIRNFCRTALSQQSDRNARSEIIMGCDNKLDSVKFIRSQIEPVQKSRAALTDLLSQLDKMPATTETFRELTRLSAGNNYRLPILTYPDQNNYLAAIGRKLEQIRPAVAQELQAERLAALSQRLSTVGPELKRFIEAHPEYQTANSAQDALHMLLMLYTADLSLEYCTEQSWFSSYKAPLAEVRHRENLLTQVAQFYGVPQAKLDQLSQVKLRARDQMRYGLKWGREPASKTCDDFVVTLSLNKPW